jgi:hypothetical protein
MLAFTLDPKDSWMAGDSYNNNDYQKLFRSLDDSIKSSECGQLLKTFIKSIHPTEFSVDERPDFGNFV